MALFSDRFLDEMRAALPVSTVVGKRLKLKRGGSKGEWTAIDNPSFTVSDPKNIWHDFGNKVGRPSGDIFDFEMEHSSCTFSEAVERLAAMAGIPLPSGSGSHQAAARAPIRASPASEPDPGFYGGFSDGSQDGPERTQEHRQVKREIVATYDYTNADSVLIYQVCRQEWEEGGKRKKSFFQRRPVDGYPGEWAVGLKAGEYVRAGNGNWYFLTDERANWKGPRVTLDDIAHGLYRFPQLREELVQDPDERRAVIISEGEAKVDVHVEWGHAATCSSGGAKHWLPYHAEEFIGADVIIEADNDEAGRLGAEKKALSLRGLASRVRVLDWGKAWPACPHKGDVKDYKKAGFDSSDYWKIVDKLTDWTPSLPETKHGAVRFSDLDRPGRRRLQWLVKGLLTRGDVSVWYGYPGCGKSYLVTDCAFAICRGVSWMGRRVRSGLVIYQAGEGGVGFEDRMRAYRQERGAKDFMEASFIMWPERVNLHVDDVSVDHMIDEAKSWSAYYDKQLEFLIVDTVSAASTGAEENASKDMSLVIDRAWKFARATGAHVALIHHMPKSGTGPRGSGVLVGNVSTVIEVLRTDEMHRDGGVQRHLRKFVVRKQKDGIDDISSDFVLDLVVIGQDEDNDNITQCVVRHVNEQAMKWADGLPSGWTLMRGTNLLLMRALVKALREHGTRPPSDVDAPDMTPCVTVGMWINALCEIRFASDPDDPPTEKHPYGAKTYAKCKKAIERTYAEKDWTGKQNLIGKDKQWVWRTTRKVGGIDEVPRPVSARPNQAPILAPGEDPYDIPEG